jgi:hypothetical protein
MIQLAISAVLLNLLVYYIIRIPLWDALHDKFFCERGSTEKEPEGALKKEPSQEPKEKTFTQEDVNRFLANEKRSWHSKYADYDELKSKVADFEKHKEELNTKELEAQKNYEKLKEGWQAKEQQYQSQLQEGQNKIKDMQITNALSQEINKQNAYPDAAELIKSMISMDENGKISVNGKVNGIDTQLSLGDGVKNFLKDRPYLVRSTGQGGAGTPPIGGTGGTPGVVTGGENLGDELQKARASGDLEKVREIKNKIRAKYQTSVL